MRLIHRPLLIGVLHVVSHPWRVLIIALAIAVACVGLAVWKLKISTDQNKLFDPNVQFFKDYLHFTEIFPENEAIYVIIEASDAANPPPVKRWTALADAWVEFAHEAYPNLDANAVRAQITPGTSALFVMSSDAVQDKVRDAFGSSHPQLIQSNLTQEQEDKLRETFSED